MTAVHWYYLMGSLAAATVIARFLGRPLIRAGAALREWTKAVTASTAQMQALAIRFEKYASETSRQVADLDRRVVILEAPK